MDSGQKIRLIREEKKMELAEVALRARLTESHLQKIELGEVAPALGTLIKLARVFGVRLGTFLDDLPDKGMVITRNHETGPVHNFSISGSGLRDNLSFMSLAREKSNRHMDPFLIEVNPETPLHGSLSSHEGEEFIYVLDGSIEVLYGKETLILKKGDSMYYDSVVGHQVKAKDNQKALILAIVYLPL
jgi:transcriptional regulator with XRE-family HTH domain